MDQATVQHSSSPASKSHPTSPQYSLTAASSCGSFYWEHVFCGMGNFTHRQGQVVRSDRSQERYHLGAGWGRVRAILEVDDAVLLHQDGREALL